MSYLYYVVDINTNTGKCLKSISFSISYLGEVTKLIRSIIVNGYWMVVLCKNELYHGWDWATGRHFFMVHFSPPVCFGSNFVPVKKFETGDGVFFQWILCCAIWLSGMVVNIARGFPQFQPFAMLGGFLWCTGNMMVVPVIKMIGLSLGMLIWGLTNLLMGWGSGNFGILGVEKAPVSSPVFNYLGVVICVISLGIYLFIKSDVEKKPKPVDEGEGLINSLEEEGKEESTSWVDRLTLLQKRIIGISLSIISGIFYGVNFNPPTYLSQHGGSSNYLDYVFSHFCGIWITSTFYFLIYCAVMKNQPKLYPGVVLPGMVSGILWSLADISWFVANQKLNIVVAFPLITTGPGLVASLWGIFVFKEITGTRNLSILAAAFGCSILGVTFIVLSKVV